ncbi:growth arrest-specific protein 8-like [Centruroides sculpturatus]|uniref:growth arrest-specific protein 8-like n=1 Tax=Centruroides sculpturatus TaxID=218467 RepID=UPI000C6CA1FB|nr:growth arrest-specific protein 8-like [Centruroides sculpturatus]
MPPKRKTDTKSSRETEENSDDLKNYAYCLQQELEQERKERNCLQEENKVFSNYILLLKLENSNLEKTVEMLNIELEMERKKCEQEALNYGKKCKHLNYENEKRIQNFENKLNEKERTRKLNSEHQILQMKSDIFRIRSKVEEKDVARLRTFDQLNLKYVEDLDREKAKCNEKIDSMRKKYDYLINQEKEKNDFLRLAECHEWKNRAKTEVEKVVERHETDLKSFAVFSKNMITDNISVVGNVKEEINKEKKKSSHYRSLANKLMQENQQLAQTNEQLASLRKQLRSRDVDKVDLKKTKSQLKSLIKTQSEEKLQIEILRQQLDSVTKERDVLMENFVKCARNIQQKAEFKRCLVERKLEITALNLERKQLELDELVNNGYVSKEILRNVELKLENILTDKNNQTAALKEEIAKQCRMHNDMIRTFECALAKYKLDAKSLGLQKMKEFKCNF